MSRRYVVPDAWLVAARRADAVGDPDLAVRIAGQILDGLPVDDPAVIAQRRTDVELARSQRGTSKGAT